MQSLPSCRRSMLCLHLAAERSPSWLRRPLATLSSSYVPYAHLTPTILFCQTATTQGTFTTVITLHSLTKVEHSVRWRSLLHLATRRHARHILPPCRP